MHQSETCYRLLLFIIYLQGPLEILTKQAVSQQLACRQFLITTTNRKCFCYSIGVGVKDQQNFCKPLIQGLASYYFPK